MDIANIANETVFDYAYPKYPHYAYVKKSYPSNDDLREMIRAFLVFWDNPELKISTDNAETFGEQLRQKPEFLKISSERIETSLLDVKKTACLNNYYFVLWCFWDMRNTEFELDYILYARDRAKAYFRSKKDLQDYLEERKIDLDGKPVP
jgi:hypothetical protein